jgi:hypothetical protein
MKAITTSKTASIILAIDLGNYKSVAWQWDVLTKRASRR